MGEDWDAEFAVELENWEPESAQAGSERPSSKRHASGLTPERFRGCSVAARVGPQLGAAGGGGGSGTTPAADASLQQEPLRSQHSAGSGGSGQQQHQQQAATGGWNVRSIFLARRPPPAPPPPQQQPAGVPGMHSPAPCLGGRFPCTSLEDDDGNDIPGPLTQMAAANTCVAAAFCPSCGCFLADLGGPPQQAAHTSTCCPAASTGAQHRAAAAAAAGQQQAAAADAGGRCGTEGREGEVEEDHSEDWQDGNWSEQEEASQAAAEGGVAAAAVGSEEGDEEAGELGEDAWAECLEEQELEQQEGPPQQQQQQEEQEGAAPAEEAAAAGAAERVVLHAWLEQRGLGKYVDHFMSAGASLSLLPCLTDSDLQQLGIVALGARKKLLLAAEELLEAAAAPGGVNGCERANGDDRWEEEREGVAAAAELAGGADQQQQQQQQQVERQRRSHAPAGPSAGGSGVGDWRALLTGGSAGGAVPSILQYFKPQGGAGSKRPAAGTAAAKPGCILSYLKAADGSSAAVASKAAAAVAAAGAGRGRGRGKAGAQQWAHKEVAAAGGGRGGGKGWGPRAAQVVPMRPWQLVPGTAFTVDRFCNLPQQSPYRHWFLTHFHADHYKGLTGKFDRGTIYCTPPTARLVVQQLRVKPACIKEVPLNSPITVDGVRVTFVEANHCPGAAMILFEPAGRRPVLHTGDCRLIEDMQQEAVLAAVRGRADLILDTTYCSPEYAFPSQKEVLRFAIDAVKAEAFNPKTLFLFGSYTIGKERLFLEAARVLQRKIYVSVAKRKILDCLDLPEEYASLLTTEDRETNVHAVPMWMVSQKHMTQLLKHYRGRFTNAVGFQPTGWAHQRDAKQTGARGRRRQKGTIITYQVPYSEHSSFSELRAFVDWFRPQAIIPSVNSDGGGPKAQALVRLLRGP